MAMVIIRGKQVKNRTIISIVEVKVLKKRPPGKNFRQFRMQLLPGKN
jgi:hypothetical protein